MPEREEQLGGWARIEATLDAGTARAIAEDVTAGDPLSFPGYADKLAALRARTGADEAAVAAQGEIGGMPVVVCALDSRFMMGSMGVAVGERVARAVEHAREHRLPLVIFSASGGARMQEGIISLMQMAKTSAAAARHSAKGLLYITVLTDPTTGGVTASFASLGDIIIAEPKVVVGFAGRRVIEGTIRQHLPDDFQSAEFLLEHGFADMVVGRDKMRRTLSHLIRLHTKEGA